MKNNPIEYQNYIIKRGDSWSRTIEIDCPNLIDWKIYFLVKEKITDLDINAKISKILFAHENSARIELSSLDTNLVGNYLYGLKLINLKSEQSITILEGIIIFTDRIIEKIS